MYTRTSRLGWDQSNAFKKAFSIDVDIDFIGVWDTVSSVGGFPVPKRLPFTSSNTSVRVFRHAVSLDERRAKFRANLFNRPTLEEASLGVQVGEMPKAGVDEQTIGPVANDTAVRSSDEAKEIRNMNQKKYGKAEKRRRHKKALSDDASESESESDLEWQNAMESRFSRMQEQPLETDVLEVWFAGCHCGERVSSFYLFELSSELLGPSSERWDGSE